MSVTGTVRVTCPACGLVHECPLVQSINTRQDAAAKQRLVAGELNVLACDCGARTQLAANLVFHDPDRDFTCQVVAAPGPGAGAGEAAMARAAATFAATGVTGTHTARLVPSQNALVEKVKLLDAGLEDWAIEMMKVLLLASLGGEALDLVLLFDHVDRDAGLIHWVRFDERGTPSPTASSLGAYDRIAAREQGRPRRGELRVDRAWAVEAVAAMIANVN